MTDASKRHSSGDIIRVAMTPPELYESGQDLLRKGETYFAALDFKFAYESLVEQYKALYRQREDVREQLEAAQALVEMARDPERWDEFLAASNPASTQDTDSEGSNA